MAQHSETPRDLPKQPKPVTVNARKAARTDIEKMAEAARKANREGKTRKFPE